ncbi:hypothetical protein ACIRRA_34420 [Nocardia sp. NPDC101769]|uniref:hypothetical protein n=1 Tax=Nocardia sp. NPDC101769 TaxID=3364333 RepID=UPI00380411C3
MSERVAEVGRGITLTYEREGSGVPLPLIAGLGQQKHEWHDGLIAQLVVRGYDVVRFDNPAALWPTFADLIDSHIRTAESRSSDAPNL